MAKRLRSLASLLWETDEDVDGEGVGADLWQRELQRENELLKQQVESLSREVVLLKARASVAVAPSLDPVCTDVMQPLSEEWMGNLRPDVSALPRLRAEVIPDLLECGSYKTHIDFDIPKNPLATASQVAQHVEDSKHPAVYKVGITANPAKRWTNGVYGYSMDKHERWEGMRILYVSSSSFSTALLETFLISCYKGAPGCRNEKPGGEGASNQAGPHFLYVVYRILKPPPRVVSRATPTGPGCCSRNWQA